MGSLDALKLVMAGHSRPKDGVAFARLCPAIPSAVRSLSPACGERVGVRGTLVRLGLAESPPHPKPSAVAEASLRRIL